MQLGLIVSDNGDYERARAIFERALVIRGERPRSRRSQGRLGAHLVTASCCSHMGDYSGAKPLLERALAIREKEFGPRCHPRWPRA